MTILSLEARFWSKVNKGSPNECWEWLRPLDQGYGRFWVEGRTRVAHRIAWQLEHGPVPEGKQIDHLCRNRSCVNPSHLEPVTLTENVLRGDGLSARNKRKKSCLNGHPFTPENTYISADGRRHCRKCGAKRTAEYWARKTKGVE